MGILDSLGVPNKLFGDANLAGIGRWALVIGLIFLVLLFVGGLTFLYYSKKVKKSQFKYQIPIFVRVAGKLSRTGIDYAKELFIPDTNISLFFLKIRKIYIARPTRAMGKDEYWYYISENGEWINFDQSISTDDDALAIANYDHRDTRYAYVNLKEIIKRNYKDKSIKWWKDPVIMNIITFVIMSIVFGVIMWIVLSKTGNMIEKLGPISESFKEIAKSMQQSVQTAQNLNSGIVPG